VFVIPLILVRRCFL